MALPYVSFSAGEPQVAQFVTLGGQQWKMPVFAPISGNDYPTVIQPFSGTLVDRSGSIITGGATQVLAYANDNRKYLFILNISSANLWFNFDAPAVLDRPSIRLRANESFVMEGSFVSKQQINIIGPTTGQKFVAKEG